MNLLIWIRKAIRFLTSLFIMRVIYYEYSFRKQVMENHCVEPAFLFNQFHRENQNNDKISRALQTEGILAPEKRRTLSHLYHP